MATGTRPNEQEDAYRPPTKRTGWYGWIAFAGIMMVTLGVFHIINGFVALFEEDYFFVGKNDLLVEVDYNGWGWTHIILGIVAVCAGGAVTLGATWARVLTVLVAFISSLVNIAFLSAYPLWSTIMIAVDFLVIWAVVAHGDRDSLNSY